MGRTISSVTSSSRNGGGPKAIAFYLPQFHPVPENDAWWGAGFTEWAKVVRARPLFDGHYQPHLPTTLGFYDLRVPEVREAQAAMARAHGIDAFCYYHYWFRGRRPFHRVVDEVLSSGEPDFPFCFCWANENWTRAWDAAQHEVLLRQEYSDVDDVEHIDYLIEVFRDQRYVRVDGRPLLLIYRVQGMPDAGRTFATWRERCVRAGVGDPLIVKFDSHGDFSDPARFGCDAAAQFPPHGVRERVVPISLRDAPEANTIFDYGEIVNTFLHREAPGWVRYECVFPSWDNAPRRPDAYIMIRNTPELFERWFKVVYERAGDGIVFINAWNEWAEGAHLEPDERWGDAFLRATARVTRRPQPGPSEAPSLAAQPLVSQASFAERYLDLYDAYVRVQRNLTALERTVERRFQHNAEAPIPDLEPAASAED